MAWASGQPGDTHIPRSELAFILADSRSRCLFIPGVYRGYDFPEMIERLITAAARFAACGTVCDASAEGAANTMLRYEDLIEPRNGLANTG